MDVGTLTGSLELEDLMSKVLDKVDQRLRSFEQSADQTFEHVSVSMRSAAAVGSFLGTTFANMALQAVSWGKTVVTNSLMAGARLEQLGAVTRFLGERAG